jgi:hypothetical protein
MYLVSLSIMTRIASYTTPVNGSLDGGSFTMKSYDIILYGLPGIGIIPISP